MNIVCDVGTVVDSRLIVRGLGLNLDSDDAGVWCLVFCVLYSVIFFVLAGKSMTRCG